MTFYITLLNNIGSLEYDSRMLGAQYEFEANGTRVVR